mgnify:CR=1 FL=1
MAKFTTIENLRHQAYQSIVGDSPTNNRVELGTKTLDDRDYWENINFNENTFQPYLTGNLETLETELRDGITYWQTRGRFDWHCGIDYIKKPLSLEHQNYDVIFIDGRCRSMCAYLATHLLKDDGYVLVHDFIPRQYYHGLLKWYDVVDKAGTLIILTKRKGGLRSNEDVKILSQELYNEYKHK